MDEKEKEEWQKVLTAFALMPGIIIDSLMPLLAVPLVMVLAYIVKGLPPAPMTDIDVLAWLCGLAVTFYLVLAQEAFKLKEDERDLTDLAAYVGSFIMAPLVTYLAGGNPKAVMRAALAVDPLALMLVCGLPVAVFYGFMLGTRLRDWLDF